VTAAVLLTLACSAGVTFTLTPLVRGEDGGLYPATWDEALDRVVEGLQRVSAEHGPDSLAFISSSRCTGEENYLVQKLARAVFRTHNVHQCAAT